MGQRPVRDWVPVILAVGLCTALNVITAGILYDAIVNPGSAGISENATQIMTGWGGGIVGILGAVFGYRAGRDVASVGPGDDNGAGADGVDLAAGGHDPVASDSD